MARKFISPQRAPKVEPPRSASSFNSSTSFEIPQILSVLPVRDVTRALSVVSSSQAIVTSLSDMSALCARMRYHLHQGCTYLTHVLSRKVLSLTKPKGMNRNPLAMILHFHGHFVKILRKILEYLKRIIQLVRNRESDKRRLKFRGRHECPLIRIWLRF